jgi:hypothetical protein
MESPVLPGFSVSGGWGLWIAHWWLRLGVLCTPEGGIDSKFAWAQISRPFGAALCAVCAASQLSNRRVLIGLLLFQT